MSNIGVFADYKISGDVFSRASNLREANLMPRGFKTWYRRGGRYEQC